MCNPEIMCRQHLLGEHNECHMFLGSLRKQINMQGYFTNDLFEPKSLQNRHDLLAKELTKRGYKHNSPLDLAESDFSYLTNQQLNHIINKNNSLKILISKCNICYQNYIKQKGILNMYAITKTFKFDAAHRLLIMPKGHKCRNLHGHSYVVKVGIFIDEILVMDNPNMVIDFGLLKKKFGSELECFDHSLILAEKDPLVHILKDHVDRLIIMPPNLDTTAENMAYLFANKINELCINEFNIKDGNIQVDVDETVGNTATYIRQIGVDIHGNPAN